MTLRHIARRTPGTPLYEVADPSGVTLSTGWATRQEAQDRADRITAGDARRTAVDRLTAPQRNIYNATKVFGAVASRSGYSLQATRRLAAMGLVTLTEKGPGVWSAVYQAELTPFMPPAVEETEQGTTDTGALGD